MDEQLQKLLQHPFRQFIDICVAWKKDTGIDLSKIDPEKCPVHQRSLFKGRCMKTVSGIELCPVCGNPMCPECGNHCVAQLSRVTGYLSSVDQWNNSKRQELLDRVRYNIGGN